MDLLRRPEPPEVPQVELVAGLVLEDPVSGYCGAVTGWKSGLVELEDRAGARRWFPLDSPLWLEGRPVRGVRPRRRAASQRTRSGSRPAPPERAKVARQGRLFVEGVHDAELLEWIWGDDLRYVGVVVEPIGGVDNLLEAIDGFGPGPRRRLGVLLDHMVPGSLESRAAETVSRRVDAEHILVEGHVHVDVWAAVSPSRFGLEAWPRIPRGVEFKAGMLAALGLPHERARDLADGWRTILDRVRTWRDLDPGLNRIVERLIDFVTADDPPIG